MVNKCSVYGCKSNNYTGHESRTVFGLQRIKDEELKKRWFKFVNRKDLDVNSTSIFVCDKHFEEKYVNKNEKRPRLINDANPVPTIHPEGVYENVPSCQPTPSRARKPPKERIYRPDEILSKEFQMLQVNNFESVDESLLKYLHTDYQCKRYEDHVIYFKTEANELSVPEVTECIELITICM